MFSSSTMSLCRERPFGTGPCRRSPRNRATATSCTRCRVVMRIFRMWSLEQRADRTWCAFPAGHPWRHHRWPRLSQRCPADDRAVQCGAARRHCGIRCLAPPKKCVGMNGFSPGSEYSSPSGLPQSRSVERLARIAAFDRRGEICPVALPRDASTRATQRELRFDRR